MEHFFLRSELFTHFFYLIVFLFQSEARQVSQLVYQFIDLYPISFYHISNFVPEEGRKLLKTFLIHHLLVLFNELLERSRHDSQGQFWSRVKEHDLGIKVYFIQVLVNTGEDIGEIEIVAIQFALPEKRLDTRDELRNT